MIESNEIELRGHKILLDSNEIVVNQKIIRLTPKEKGVLLFLYNNMGRTVSRSQILETVWGDSFGNDSGLTQAISKLRKVFKDDPRQPKLIKTVPKSGYQLVDDSNDSHKPKIRSSRFIDYFRVLSRYRTQSFLLFLLLLVLFYLFFINGIEIRVESLPE